MIPFVDLTPEVRRELHHRRIAPVLRGLWIGLVLGTFLTTLAFVVVAICRGV